LRTLFAHNSAQHVLNTIRRDDRFTAFRRQFEIPRGLGISLSAELMLTIPSLQEDPSGHRAAEDAPAEKVRRPARPWLGRRWSASPRPRSAASAAAPIAAKAFAVWILRAGRSARWRIANARLKQALFTRCRRIALAIEERFVSGGFCSAGRRLHATCQEIDGLAGRHVPLWRQAQLSSAIASMSITPCSLGHHSSSGW
jgi:hypothetical protein